MRSPEDVPRLCGQERSDGFVIFEILWRRTLLDTRAFTVGRTEVRVQESTDGFLACQFRRMLRSRAMASGFAVSVIHFVGVCILVSGSCRNICTLTRAITLSLVLSVTFITAGKDNELLPHWR